MLIKSVIKAGSWRLIVVILQLIKERNIIIYGLFIMCYPDILISSRKLEHRI